MAGKAPEGTGSRCKECGAALVQAEGMKTKVFCSAQCRKKWWKEHPEMLDKKALYTHTCAGCGRKFTAYGNSRRKYCSHACYTRTGLEEAWQMTEEQFRAEKLYYTGKGRFRLQNATTASIASPASFAMLAYP